MAVPIAQRFYLLLTQLSLQTWHAPDVIRRALQLWTNPQDVVLSPFMGIGSEGYVSIEMDRRFIGIELKESYFKVASRNLSGIELNKNAQGMLFDLESIGAVGCK